MIGQCALAKGTAAARNGKAEATMTRLMALLRITALQRCEAECADQQRQPKLGTAKADQPAERPDDRASAKRGGRVAFSTSC
jgi:hypothetical protein